jgi:Flp pilus assembly protein TadG
VRHPPRRAAESEQGQASVELFGALPALLLLGLIIFQLLAVGYASVLAGSAAEAGALALAGGGDPRRGARDAVPGASGVRMRVEVSGGRVEVRMHPPSPLAAVAERLEVRAEASVVEG